MFVAMTLLVCDGADNASVGGTAEILAAYQDAGVLELRHEPPQFLWSPRALSEVRGGGAEVAVPGSWMARAPARRGDLVPEAVLPEQLAKVVG